MWKTPEQETRNQAPWRFLFLLTSASRKGVAPLAAVMPPQQRRTPMNRFVEKNSAKLLGVISGFDRLVLKGTLRSLCYPAGMMGFLLEKEVLLKAFGPYVQEVSEQLKEASQQEAGRLGRTNRYLGCSQTRKEPIARAIAQKEGIEEGVICLLRTGEPGISD